MEKPGEEQRISIEQVSGKVDTIVSQLWKIEEHKWDILKLLNQTEEIINIFWKMKLGKMITSMEYNKIIEFFQNGDVKIWKSDKWIFFQGIFDWNKRKSDLANFIEQYPLVIDADEIDEDNAEWWLITTSKNNETRFIQIIKDDKGTPSIRFASKAYYWHAVLPKDDPDNKQLIEIKTSNQTIFLQEEVAPDWIITVQKIADLVGEHNGTFDRDNLSVLYKRDSMFSIIHKSELADWTLKIEEVLTFKRSSRYDVMFDRYNSFEAQSEDIGKIICKKRYNEQWEFIWIDVFKKLRLGGERVIHNNCRWIKKNENPFTR